MPLLVPGGLLVADNAVGFEDVMQPMLDRALTDERVDAVIVRFLTGQLICRRLQEPTPPARPTALAG